MYEPQRSSAAGSKERRRERRPATLHAAKLRIEHSSARRLALCCAELGSYHSEPRSLLPAVLIVRTRLSLPTA
eukprot:6193795-Pleurochrysis_carterae.AAC.1